MGFGKRNGFRIGLSCLSDGKDESENSLKSEASTKAAVMTMHVYGMIPQVITYTHHSLLNHGEQK